jgi:DNA-binding PadR family transcriptional regulator
MPEEPEGKMGHHREDFSHFKHMYGADPRGEGWFAGRGRHRGGRRDGGGEGPFGFGPPGGGFGAPGGFGPPGGSPWPGFRRGPRARRGDIRAGILALLKESPRNGYQIMQELEQRSQGMWHPSPGSIYPALQQLEDEGLVQPESAGVGRTFRLTDAGRTYVDQHPEEVEAPWGAISQAAGDGFLAIANLVRQVHAAAVQVAHTGNAAQLAEAQKILAGARRALYHLLAEDAPDDE